MNSSHLRDLLFLAAVLLSLLLITTPFLKVPVAAAFVLLYALLNREKFHMIGISLPMDYPIQVLKAGGVAIVVVLFFFYALSPLVTKITGDTIESSSFDYLLGNRQALINTLIIGWIIGGVLEELVFRGFLLNKIQQYLPSKFAPVVAVLLTSSLFGYLHEYQGFTGQILTGSMGAILAGITLYNRRSVWMSIWVHGFFNTISILGIYSGIFAI